MAATAEALPMGVSGDNPAAGTLAPAPLTTMTETPQADGANPGAAALPQPTSLAVFSSLGGVLQQPAVKKSMPAIIVLVVLLILGGLYAWSNETPYRPVFPGMAEADQQSAMETLKAGNFAPRLDVTTGQLTVPANRYHEARILLASQGIPRMQGRGILDTLKDQSAMTTSQFMEQARYGAAIEQELAKSITQIGTIQSARVHLAQAKQSPFLRDRTPVKASIVVTPFTGRVVTTGQVEAIVHLVASSVPYLANEDVSVVDNLGNLLTKPSVDPLLGLTSAQAQHKQQVEETYRNRIMQLLEPVVGEGNVRAQVDLVMDFTQSETATEDFDSQKNGPKTRSEMLSEDRNTQIEATGVPGALTNLPPSEPKTTADIAPTEEKKGGQSVTTNKSARNFEIDKTVRHVKQALGKIDRVSASVVIKDRSPEAAKEGAPAAAAPAGYSPEELDRFQSLVKGVVGFSKDRGDMVSLMATRFEPPLAHGPAWYETEAFANGLKLGLAALVLVVLLLTVVRPVVKSYLPPPPPPPAPEPTAEEAAAATGEGGDGEGGEGGENAEGGEGAEDGDNAEAGEGETEAKEEEDSMTMAEGESLEDFKARLKKSAPKKPSISADMLDTANTYDDKVALIRMLVQEDSGRVATVLKNMIKRSLPE